MAEGTPGVIRRPDKGLTIVGTRVTVYSLLDYLHAGWPHEEIRDWLNLTTEQLQGALAYIDGHRDEVEAEYREVVRAAGERRRYWEEQLRRHLASEASPSPEKAALYAKLAEQRGEMLHELLRGDDTARVETNRS